MRISGIITAAGLSSRMAPDHKLVMDINGQTLIQRSVQSLQVFCDQIIIVTGAYPDEIKNTLIGFECLEFVYNPHYIKGMVTSIRSGLMVAKGERIFILPGDCPFTSMDVCERMLKSSGEIVIPTYHDKHGHPILMSKNVADDFLSQPDIESLRAFISTKTPSFVESDDERILWDIDTPSDIQKAKLYFQMKEGA